MQLTAKTTYAIRALIDIASSTTDSPKPLVKIASNQNITLNFLEQIFADLKRAGIVSAIKGPGGGYLLAKAPDEIALVDVFVAVSEPYHITSCGNQNSCITGHSHKCSSHFFLEDLSNHVINYLRSVSIADLALRYHNYIKSQNWELELLNRG
jgi:Rrf2 family transcriptional regulator, iron-sulfur cluster assembly transcription factor